MTGSFSSVVTGVFLSLTVVLLLENVYLNSVLSPIPEVDANLNQYPIFL